MYLNTRIFPTTGYARVLLFMFIRRELGGTGTGCLFQFIYCAYKRVKNNFQRMQQSQTTSALKQKDDVFSQKLACAK